MGHQRSPADSKKPHRARHLPRPALFTELINRIGEFNLVRAIDQVRGELPDGILEPQVFKAETSSDPIAYFAVSADDMTIEQLSWFIDDTVAKRLLSIEGIDRNLISAARTLGCTPWQAFRRVTLPLL